MMADGIPDPAGPLGTPPTGKPVSAVNPPSNERVARMMLRAVYQMSDHAEALGGAKTIAGVAALHKLQTSLQKNRARAAEYLDNNFD
jgi:hypothetical protein